MNKYQIVIPRWEEFQHYKRREPPWLKVYTRLHSDDTYLDLSSHLRGVLLGIWIEYARSGCDLAVTTATLTRRLNVKVTTRDLETLNHAGYIELLLADCKHDASDLLEQRQRQRQKTETKSSKAVRSKTTSRPISAEKRRELERILELCTDPDAGSRGVLESIGRSLPLGSIAKVHESVQLRAPVTSVTR